MLNRSLRIVILLMILGAGTAACGALDDAQDRAETVDEAVRLLQAVEDNSAWSTIIDGLDELDAVEQGYALAVHYRESPLSDTGSSDTGVEQIITIRVDADDHALAEISDGGRTDTYFIEAFRVGDNAPVYRGAGGEYTCAQQDEVGRLLQGGPRGLFEGYAVDAASVRLLTIVERDEDGDESLVGRDAIRYRVESRVADARDILEQLDNDALQAKVNAAGIEVFSGALYLDEETLALLRYESDTTDPAAGRWTEFRFEITAWDYDADIPAPAEDEIDVPCQ